MDIMFSIDVEFGIISFAKEPKWHVMVQRTQPRLISRRVATSLPSRCSFQALFPVLRKRGNNGLWKDNRGD
jgi:hypothetical protein